MRFERIIEGKDHLWAVRDMAKPKNELAMLFEEQLDKLNHCRQYLISNGVFDADSFISLREEKES